MRPATTISPRAAFLQSLATIVLVVFVLAAARSVIIPILLAVLGSFVLAPIVGVIERTGLHRVPAALITLALALVSVCGIGWVVVYQVNGLARTLPEHRKEIQQKVDQLRGSGGPFSAVLDLIRDVTAGGAAADTSGNPGVEATDGTATTPNSTIVVAPVDNSSELARMAQSALVLVEPLAAAGLVAVLIAFMLIGREDLRDRLLSVAGRERLLGTTRVLVDSAQKVSRLLLFQLILNAGFGLVLTVGLLIIGVPYAPLWGFLSALLRFVPYVGTWMSALFPFVLSFATSVGWGQPIAVFVYFLILDLVTANVVEPLLIGHNVGVSPIALLVAAAFWTWLWGTVGLVLSTPITICLAVIGQHVPRLRPLALLLGNTPALPAALRFYQRLLAKDRPGAAAVMAEASLHNGAAEMYDAVVLPALATASRDRAAGRLTAEEEQAVLESAFAIVDAAAPPAPAHNGVPQPAAAGPPVIVSVPAHRSAEELPLRMISQVLLPEGYCVKEGTTQLLPAQVERLIEESGAGAVVVSVLPPGGIPQTFYLCRRLRKRFPNLPIVVSYTGPIANYDRLLVRMRKSGVTYVTTSLVQTCGQIRSLLAPSSAALAVGP
jgi:predicted PurR-regulated permease PerM